MKVPFVDLKTQYQGIKSRILESIDRICTESSFILGPDVLQFEENFANRLRSAHCVAVANGTEAISLALESLEVGPGDEVIVPAHTFVATAIGVLAVGATPVLCDIRPSDYLLDLEQAESLITARTRALLPVHLYGRVCNMRQLIDIADRHSLKIVEDAAQAHGAVFDGKAVGTFGECGCFSFYPGKNLGAYGDGGAVLTQSPAICKKLKALRNYGSEIKYVHPERGTNSRLDSIQAAVLNIKLEHLDKWNRARMTAALTYNECLAPIVSKGLILPEVPEHGQHVFHLYVIQSPRRDELLSFLRSKDIEVGIHYPTPFYLQSGYSNLGYKAGSFPVTEQISTRILSLPMFPEITRAQIEYVTDNIEDFFA